MEFSTNSTHPDAGLRTVSFTSPALLTMTLTFRAVLNIHWKDWCWSWNSNPLATWCEELTHLKRPWCWERLKVGGEGDDRGWDSWMASPTQWTRVWVDSRSWWWTGRPGVLQSMGSQRVGHNWVNWTDLPTPYFLLNLLIQHLNRWENLYYRFWGPHLWRPMTKAIP